MGNSIDKQHYTTKLKSGKYAICIPYSVKSNEHNGDFAYGFYIVKQEFNTKKDAVYNADLFIANVLKDIDKLNNKKLYKEYRNTTYKTPKYVKEIIPYKFTQNFF